MEPASLEKFPAPISGTGHVYGGAPIQGQTLVIARQVEHPLVEVVDGQGST